MEKSIELGTFCNEVKGIRQQWSLANLAKEVIRGNLNKDKNVRMGHWENPNLTPEQQMYAAVDVYVREFLFWFLKMANFNLFIYNRLVS